MLESEIKKLTVAVEANTAALTGGAVAPVKTGGAAVTAPAAAAPAAAAPAAAAPAAAAPAAAAAAPAAAAPAAAAPAAAAPAAAASAVTAPAAGAAAAPAVVEVDKKALTQKFIELAQAKGREVAQQLLAEYGVASLPELKDKTQWPAFFAACDAKLAG